MLIVRPNASRKPPQIRVRVQEPIVVILLLLLRPPLDGPDEGLDAASFPDQAIDPDVVPDDLVQDEPSMLAAPGLPLARRRDRRRAGQGRGDLPAESASLIG